MKPIVEPQWMKGLKGDSSLNSRDMLNLFDYKSQSNITRLVSQGYLPKPSRKIKGWSHTTLQWEVSYVRKILLLNQESKNATKH